MATKDSDMITITKSELAKMVAEAVETAKDDLRAEVKKAETSKGDQQAAENPWLNELVEIELFKDGKDYVDDVCVQVNGRSWVIKRGYRVKVSRFVKLVLDNQQRQTMAAVEYQQAQQKEFKEASIRYNI